MKGERRFLPTPEGGGIRAQDLMSRAELRNSRLKARMDHRSLMRQEMTSLVLHARAMRQSHKIVDFPRWVSNTEAEARAA